MSSQPRRITIVSDGNNSFTVVTEEWANPALFADGLCYDEMIGTVARLMCPTLENGAIDRSRYCRPLFLEAPKPEAKGGAK